MKEHSEHERLRSLGYQHNYSRVDGIRTRDSGEEGGRNQTAKGCVCTIRNFSFLILRAMWSHQKVQMGKLVTNGSFFGSMVWLGVCKWAQLWDNEVGTRVMVFKKWSNVRSKINVPYQWERWERVIGLWIDILSLIHAFKNLRNWLCLENSDYATMWMVKHFTWGEVEHWPIQAQKF